MANKDCKRIRAMRHIIPIHIIYICLYIIRMLRSFVVLPLIIDSWLNCFSFESTFSADYCSLDIFFVFQQMHTNVFKVVFFSILFLP